MVFSRGRPCELERVASDNVVHLISVDNLHSINFRNDVTKFVVISMKTEKITPQYRIVLNSLQCYLPKPDQSHMDVLWEPSVPFRGNYMGPLIIPNGNERSLSKYQIAGFQVPGREETSTTIGAASFHHCIAEVVCGVHPWMLARQVVTMLSVS